MRHRRPYHRMSGARTADRASAISRSATSPSDSQPSIGRPPPPSGSRASASGGPPSPNRAASRVGRPRTYIVAASISEVWTCARSSFAQRRPGGGQIRLGEVCSMLDAPDVVARQVAVDERLGRHLDRRRGRAGGCGHPVPMLPSVGLDRASRRSPSTLDDGAARRQGPVRPAPPRPGAGRAEGLTPSPVDGRCARRRTRVSLRRMLALTQRPDGDAMTSPARLRPSEVLAAHIAALRAASKGTDSEFLRGALDALHWVIEGGPGPLTADAAHKPVTVRAVVHRWPPPRPSSTGAGSTAPLRPRRRTCPDVGPYATAAPPVPPHATPHRQRTLHLRDQAVG